MAITLIKTSGECQKEPMGKIRLPYRELIQLSGAEATCHLNDNLYADVAERE